MGGCPAAVIASVRLSRYVVDDVARTCTTTFADGLTVVAAPNMDTESRARARALGYEGSDEQVVWAMTVDHDYLHSVLAEAQGGCSPVLMAVAHGTEMPEDQIWREEALVLCVQELLNRARRERGTGRLDIDHTAVLGS